VIGELIPEKAERPTEVKVHATPSRHRRISKMDVTIQIIKEASLIWQHLTNLVRSISRNISSVECMAELFQSLVL